MLKVPGNNRAVSHVCDENQFLKDRIQEELETYNNFINHIKKIDENVKEVNKLLPLLSINDVKTEEDLSKFYKVKWKIYELLEECGL